MTGRSSAPLHLVDPGALDVLGPGTSTLLDGDEGRHAAAVRRTRPGERVDLADGLGRLAECEVVGVGRGGLELRVLAVRDVPAPRPRLVLVQALAKGGRDEQAVESATELGVDAVVPWQAARSVPLWSGERSERGRRRWEAVARAATKQSRRARTPVVEPVVALPGLVRRCTGPGVLALVLDGDGGAALVSDPLPLEGVEEVLVVVGPEGGVDGAEIEALAGAGGIAVRLGPSVLRTSSAGPAALVLLSARLGRWA